ncbi:MAG: hypothetical protein M2R45_04600 [Verrucomicrobia subdivision 3 bacterium]|nr:hypothetical protein [Limisphaerales bacterium]MCS1417337.1 hypothetical protein [Limisphaerales bacterium]
MCPNTSRNHEHSSAPVKSGLNFLHVAQEKSSRCLVVRYLVHPTVLGSGNFEISGEYPGYLMQHLEASTGRKRYTWGAVGSTGHRVPEAETDFERSELMRRSWLDECLQPWMLD